MAFDGDSTEHERTIQEQNRTMIDLFRAILMGIEMIADQEQGTLIEDIED